jgi:hypothetical protein
MATIDPNAPGVAVSDPNPTVDPSLFNASVANVPATQVALAPPIVAGGATLTPQQLANIKNYLDYLYSLPATQIPSSVRMATPSISSGKYADIGTYLVALELVLATRDLFNEIAFFQLKMRAADLLIANYGDDWRAVSKTWTREQEASVVIMLNQLMDLNPNIDPLELRPLIDALIIRITGANPVGRNEISPPPVLVGQIDLGVSGTFTIPLPPQTPPYDPTNDAKVWNSVVGDGSVSLLTTDPQSSTFESIGKKFIEVLNRLAQNKLISIEEGKAALNLLWLAWKGKEARSFVDGYQTLFTTRAPQSIGEASFQDWEKIGDTLIQTAAYFSDNPIWGNYRKAFNNLSAIYAARVAVNDFMNGRDVPHATVNNAIDYLSKYDPNKNDGGYSSFLKNVYKLSYYRDQIPKGTIPNQIDVKKFLEKVEPSIPAGGFNANANKFSVTANADGSLNITDANGAALGRIFVDSDGKARIVSADGNISAEILYPYKKRFTPGGPNSKNEGDRITEYYSDGSDYTWERKGDDWDLISSNGSGPPPKGPGQGKIVADNPEEPNRGWFYDLTQFIKEHPAYVLIGSLLTGFGSIGALLITSGINLRNPVPIVDNYFLWYGYNTFLGISNNEQTLASIISQIQTKVNGAKDGILNTFKSMLDSSKTAIKDKIGTNISILETEKSKIQIVISELANTKQTLLKDEKNITADLNDAKKALTDMQEKIDDDIKDEFGKIPADWRDETTPDGNVKVTINVPNHFRGTTSDYESILREMKIFGGTPDENSRTVTYIRTVPNADRIAETLTIIEKSNKSLASITQALKNIDYKIESNTKGFVALSDQIIQYKGDLTSLNDKPVTKDLLNKYKINIIAIDKTFPEKLDVFDKTLTQAGMVLAALKEQYAQRNKDLSEFDPNYAEKKAALTEFDIAIKDLENLIKKYRQDLDDIRRDTRINSNQSSISNNPSLVASLENVQGVIPQQMSYFSLLTDPNFRISSLTPADMAHMIVNYDALQDALANGEISVLPASEDLMSALQGAILGTAPAEEAPLVRLDQPLIDLPPAGPNFAQEVSKQLSDIATYLGWANSLLANIDPKIAAEIGKAISVANAGSALLNLADGTASAIDIEKAALALFNAAASFLPDVAKLSPYVNTGRQAIDLIRALTTPQQTVTIGGQVFVNAGNGQFLAANVAGFATAASAAGLGGSIAGLLGAQQGVIDALNGASILFQGISLIGSVGMTVPIIGWAVSVVSFIIGLFNRNKEQWSKWQTIMENVSVDGGQGADGQVLKDDHVRQKTSSKKRNRVEYVADASQTPLHDARFTLRPETVPQDDPNGGIKVTQHRRGASYVDVQLEDGRQARLYSRGTDKKTGETVWEGNDHNDSRIRLTESQLRPQIEVPTGNYILDLSVGFRAINPDVDRVSKSQSFVITADQAAQLRAAFGDDSGHVRASDGRIELFRPWVNKMGRIQYKTDHTTPNVFTYDDFNLDGVPDLLRQGILEGLRARADGKYEVALNEHFGAPVFSYTAKTMKEAYNVGLRSNVLMQYLASHPELYDLYRSKPQDHASGNLTLIYRHARDTGILPLLDELMSLAGPPQGATPLDQLLDMALRGARIAEIKEQLGITVDPAYLAQYPDLAAAFNNNTLQLLNHYVTYGNSEGRAVNASGQVLARWQPNADDWSDIQALSYAASYTDLMNAFGANDAAARTHWNNHGRWEGRSTTFNVDAYLAANPHVRQMAIDELTKAPEAVIHPRQKRRGGGMTVTLPDVGTVTLYARGSNDDGERLYRYEYHDRHRYITQSQLDAMTAASAPSEDEIRMFALNYYITQDRHPFLLQTGTALHETDKTFEHKTYDWNGDGVQDLVAIKKSATGTGSTEVHILDGATNYSTFLLHTGTMLHETGDNFEFEVADWNRDGRMDLVAIKKNATGTGSTEVHVYDGATNFSTPLLHTGTMLGETASGNASEEFEIADWNGDGLQDLVLIKKNATGTGSTEVHIYDGATNFSTPLLHTGTALGVTGPADQFEFTDWNRDGRQDLVLIKQAQTGTGTTEVHVYDGATNFSTPLLHTGTALHETGDNFEFEIADWNRDGRLDIVALKKNATGTATTEVHVLNGLTGGKSPMTQG